MTRFVLVRHGETEWNREEVFRGRADIPLNERGRAQAEAVARALAGVPLQAVYSSPLSRALETARALGRPHGLEVRVHPGLVDLDYGAWQGRPHAEVRRLYPRLYRRWLERPETVRFPGGESLREAARRALAAVQELARAHPAGPDEGWVALVAHRVINKLLVCELLGVGPGGFWKVGQDTAALNVFDYGPEGSVVRVINDTCHLGRNPAGPPERDF
ncbi:MAG: histidine phosphatase family protein [Acetobacteraceae bacterium]|nr:histidine phosphatase family protein [Acetobacteraceae bacterium]